MRTAKTLIRLGGCPDWSEYSLGAHAILLVLSCGGSYSLCELQGSSYWYTETMSDNASLFWRSLKKELFTIVRFVNYRKTPKYSDTRKICCNPPEVWTKWLYHIVMRPKDADGMINSVDPDQRVSLIWVYTVCSDLFVRNFRTITVGCVKFRFRLCENLYTYLILKIVQTLFVN